MKLFGYAAQFKTSPLAPFNLRVRAFAFGIALTSQVIGSPARADTTPAATDRLERATASSNLEDPTLRPFHLRIALNLFDEAGKNPIQGTVEIWRAGAESKKVATIGSSSETVIVHGGQTFRSTVGSPPPQRINDLVRQFLHPGPFPSEIAQTIPQLRKSTFAKTPLDCVELSLPIKTVGFAPEIGMFRSYCLSPAQNQLVVTLDFGNVTAVRTRLGKFLNHDATLEVSLLDGATKIADARTTSLTTFAPEEGTFLPDGKMKRVPSGPQPVSVDIMQKRLVSKAVAVYPDSKRSGSHPSGSVTLRAIIGRDGHVESVTPIAVDDADLGLSALNAARKYVYKPYLLDGEPVEVETTITIYFNSVTH